MIKGKSVIPALWEMIEKLTTLNIKKKQTLEWCHGQLQVFGKVDVFQGFEIPVCKGIDETWFRIVFSPVYEYFLSNTDIEESYSSWAWSFYHLTQKRTK